VVRLRTGVFDAVGKRSRHGGILAPLLGGLYLGTRRAIWPLEAAVRLRAAGVPTPAVLAVGWRRVVGPFYAHALVTESVPAAMNLQGALAARPAIGRRRALLRAAGRTVRAMHAAGFLHADLNLANLVVEETGGGLIVHVVDLDRGRFVTQPAEMRPANLRRMVRSWEKWLGDSVPPGPRDAAAFLQAYCGGDRAAKRRCLRDLTRYRSGLGARRWAWRRLGGPASDPRPRAGGEQG
jgi:tRNA A-37 threonylcarbamoyl transferase component Bud32